MRYDRRILIPLAAMGLLLPTYVALALFDDAPDLLPYYLPMVVVSIFVWVISTFITFGFSIYNEFDAIRRLIRMARTGENGAARVVAEWFVKKHAYLLTASLAEIGLWTLALTGPAGSGSDTPNVRGVLYVFLFDIINLCICLLAVGTTIVNRALTYYAREKTQVSDEAEREIETLRQRVAELEAELAT